MRRPQSLHDKKDVECISDAGSSNAFTRMRRFLSHSLGRTSHSSSSKFKDVPSSSHWTSQGPSHRGLQSPIDLKDEGQAIFGKPLEDIMSVEENDAPYGVPSFFHDLCKHMLDFGISYELLVEDCSRPAVILDPGNKRPLVSEKERKVMASAQLFRLFLDELPHPVMCKRTVSSLTKFYKDMENLDENGGVDMMLFEESAYHIRSILVRTLPWYSLQFLQYLIAFLHQLLTSNYNTCPIITSSLSELLGRVLTKDNTSHGLAKLLLLNYALIFQDMNQFAQERIYSSDSSSSSPALDSADLYTPDDEDAGQCGSSSWPVTELPDDSSPTTTTTDTEEFRSPPVSPLKLGPSSGHTARMGIGSTEEFTSSGPKDDFIPAKYSPLNQKYLPSITGLLDSSYVDNWTRHSIEPRKDDSQTDESYETTSADGSGASGDAASESSCSDGGGEAEEVDSDDRGVPCPNEERRFSERRIRRVHRHSSYPKRKSRRKYHKHWEPVVTVSSDGDDEEEDGANSVPNPSPNPESDPESSINFAHLLSNDSTAPADPYDPVPQGSSQSFSALLATSSDPVIRSNRIPIGNLQDFVEDDVEETFAHDWQRTAPLYSRSVDECWHPSDDISLKKSRSHRTGSLPQEKSLLSSSYLTDWTRDFSVNTASSSALKRLTKTINSIKKKIRRFEEDFEQSCGYRPSHSDKMKHKEIKKYMSDLTKAKRELRQLKDEILEKTSSYFPSKYFPMSLLRCQESTVGAVSERDPSSEAAALSSDMTRNTFKKVEECLNSKRTEANRPVEVKELTLSQLQDEKSDIQRALLYFESMHGRPSNKEAKDLVKPLYDRYRLVKRSVNKMKLRQKDSMIELAPILEHVAMDFTLASPQHRGSLKDELDEKEPWERTSGEPFPLNEDPHPEVNPAPPLSPTTASAMAIASAPVANPSPSPPPSSSSPSFPELNLGDLHALPLQELKERRREAKEEKKTLRYSLREFEEHFERETGRKMQKEDRGSMEKTYNEYKHVKAKLRLLEALISKHSSI